MAPISLATINLVAVVVQTFLIGVLFILFAEALGISLKRHASNDSAARSLPGSGSSSRRIVRVLKTYFSRPLNVGSVIMFICAITVGNTRQSLTKSLIKTLRHGLSPLLASSPPSRTLARIPTVAWSRTYIMPVLPKDYGWRRCSATPSRLS